MVVLSEPIPLPQSLAERDQQLLPFAPQIAKFYGEDFKEEKAHKTISSVRHASHIIYAMEGDQPVGFYAYRIRSKENPEDQEFYENLSLDKLPVELYPEFLGDEDKDAVKRALAEIKNDWNVVEIMDKAIYQPYRGKELNLALQEAAVRHLPPEKRLYLGDISSEFSLMQRPKLGGVTYSGGEILEPDRPMPLGLNEAQFKVVAQVLAHAFTAHHYPFALEAAAGETGFDKNGTLASDVWDDPASISDKDWGPNNTALPQARKALGKAIEKQQKTGEIHSNITVTAVENPAAKISQMPVQTLVPAAA